MSLGTRISDLLTNNNLTQNDLSNLTGINKSVLNRIIAGSRPARADELKDISNALGVSSDFLIGNDQQKKYYDLTEKEKVDIGTEVDKLIQGLYSDAEMNFYGEPMTDEGKEKLRMAIQMAMELNKKQAKEKFTPKKYRNK